MNFRFESFALVALLLLRHAWAQPALIPESETAQKPTPQRLGLVHAAAQRDGWAPQAGILRSAAIHAYEQQKLAAAEAWFYVYRWAALLGQMSGSEFGVGWINAVNQAKVGHQNMPRTLAGEDRPLGLALSPPLQAWLIGDAGFSEEFFSLLSPVDFLPRVFEILDDLHRRDPSKFKSYANLALAIAIVYDVPPPPVWPHGQVTAVALPRRFPAPHESYSWWIRQEQQGRLFHRLSSLGAEELKFVVDVSAGFAELEWAQNASHAQLPQLASVYSMVRYRTDRATNGVAVWPATSYKLSEILAAGGICADQAYFATQVGKARGVPTLLFYGSGNDGRHAWFGFLDGNRKWQLDAGRYAEQRFVTGFARDPQTWRELTDHELKFLSERFHRLPSYRQSRIHAQFAAEYLAADGAAKAAAAARKAVSFERRNQWGWELLVLAAQKEGKDAKTVESVLREAALAFRNYPDLEAYYLNRVSESLRSRGETSAATAEVRGVARKNEVRRTDLSVQQARHLLLQSMGRQTLAEQIRTYNSTLDTFGAGAGLDFFDQVVTLFVQHLVKLRQPVEAKRAIERARGTLKVEPNSQLFKEFERLSQELGK